MLQIFIYILKWIQQNKFAYLITVALVIAIVEWCKSFVIARAQKPNSPEDIQPSTVRLGKKKFLKQFILFFVTAIIPTAISLYYPFDVDNSSTASPDGYIKLMFFDGKFAYHDFPGQYVYYDENDIVSPLDRSFFSDPIAPLAYITIVDGSGQVVYDGKSEHMESHLIPIKYGEYKIIVSCDNYQKYEVEVSLTPYNKKADTWTHKVNLIPETYIATDVQIQAVNSIGIPYSNFEISIGYPGYTLSTYTDDNGIVYNFYILAKGEYLLHIDEADISGRFVINELTEDYATIVVTLD